MRLIIGLCTALVLMAALPTDASAQAVAQVNTVEVPAGKTADYMAGLEKILALIERVVPEAEARVWQATIAGTSSNRISVVTEFDSVEAWAVGTSRLVADPAYQPLIGELEATGRTVVSVSLATEITP